jgi:hypothetical protein
MAKSAIVWAQEQERTFCRAYKFKGSAEKKRRILRFERAFDARKRKNPQTK